MVAPVVTEVLNALTNVSNILDQTVYRSAIHLVKAATNRQAYVTMVVFLGGKVSFVMKPVIKICMAKTVADLVDNV